MAKRRKKRSGASNGVKIIIAYLESHNLKFKTEHRFKECKNIRPLPFDFLITLENTIALIEYNGIQHYKFCRKFHKSKKGLTKQQLHDLIKIDYCKTNKIPFLVISYEDEDKIPELCAEFFKNLFV